MSARLSSGTGDQSFESFVDGTFIESLTTVISDSTESGDKHPDQRGLP